MNRRQGQKILAAMAAIGLMLTAGVACAASDKPAHPELSEQEQLIDCAACHQEATQEIVKQWNDSVHGIAMVKCYQCHGTFGDFMVTPTRDNCATCHADKLANHGAEMGKAADTACWECHVPHTFAAKK